MDPTIQTPSSSSDIPPEPPLAQNPSRRGFAALTPERRREIASMGGRTAHASGAAHKFSLEEARVAGQRGGEVVSQNRDHMARIGRLGGFGRGRRLAARASSMS